MWFLIRSPILSRVLSYSLKRLQARRSQTLPLLVYNSHRGRIIRTILCRRKLTRLYLNLRQSGLTWHRPVGAFFQYQLWIFRLMLHPLPDYASYGVSNSNAEFGHSKFPTLQDTSHDGLRCLFDMMIMLPDSAFVDCSDEQRVVS